MRDKLHAYLLERPSGASAGELLDLIFTQPGRDAEFGPRFVRSLLSGDPRFAFREESGRWVATQHAALDRTLADLDYVVFDLETTGGAPAGGDGIIEIGAVRVQGGRPAARFQQLVDPRRRLPPFITRLTGISDGMLAGQPSIGDVLPRFLEFAGDAVLVAHNAAFDMSFLRAALHAVGAPPPAVPHLCTLRLARRLLPGVRRRSLDSLAGHFGIPIADRHRALGDARITAEVLLHLLEALAARGVVRLAEAIDLQFRARDGRRFECLLPRAAVDALPDQPGIYRFFGDDDRLLYIGKAKSLQRRVSSYLANSSAHGARTLDLIRHIRDVQVEVTATELEASLREAEEIRRCQPPYNQRSKHLPRIAFLELTQRTPYPRLRITSRIGRGRSFGPFRGRASAQEVLDVLAQVFRLRTCSPRLAPDPDFSPCFQGQIGACSMPCAARVTREQYARQAADAEAFFAGDMSALVADLARRRDEHSEALRFEAAARVQRQIELVGRLARRQRTLGWVVERQHYLVLQPALHGDGALAYVATHGRLRERALLRSRDDLAALAERLAARLAEPAPARLETELVEGTTILAAWLRARGERDGYVFAVAEGESIAARLPEWGAALDSLLAIADAAAGQAG